MPADIPPVSCHSVSRGVVHCCIGFASRRSSVGISQFNSGSARVDSSALSGTGTGAAGVDGIFLGTRITNTLIVGGVTNDDMATNCRNTYDENLDPVIC